MMSIAAKIYKFTFKAFSPFYLSSIIKIMWHLFNRNDKIESDMEGMAKSWGNGNGISYNRANAAPLITWRSMKRCWTGTAGGRSAPS
ncbi:hypothetical protein NCCP2716_05980 [Sporosarcina sp. NCCP-2716]|nr:hypothetical protein NCCP2716_05980 [Sporosarcina sp. NCCP-2716]